MQFYSSFDREYLQTPVLTINIIKEELESLHLVLYQNNSGYSVNNLEGEKFIDLVHIKENSEDIVKEDSDKFRKPL